MPVGLSANRQSEMLGSRAGVCPRMKPRIWYGRFALPKAHGVVEARDSKANAGQGV
jgi:hypothetical protein